MYGRNQKTESIRVLFLIGKEADATQISTALSESNISFAVITIRNLSQLTKSPFNSKNYYDLLLVDYDILNDSELCQQFRQASADAATLLLAPPGNECQAVKAIHQGIDEYVIKDRQGHYLQILPQSLVNTLARKHQQLIAAKIRRQEQVELVTLVHELKSRNAELDSFAQMVAHDLKNPLSALSGLAQLLGDEQIEISTVERVSIGQTISSCGLKAINIVDELLKLGQSKSDVEMSLLDNEAIVGEALLRLMILHSDTQPIIHEPESWPRAIGYNPWVEEVWTNYISNALKYGGRPCEVWLGGDYLDNGMTRYWVRDNGAGLSDRDKRRLFQPYTRLHQGSEEGTGLGLSIVKRIVERQGGQVGVTDAANSGCEFWFTLPTGLLVDTFEFSSDQIGLRAGLKHELFAPLLSS